MKYTKEFEKYWRNTNIEFWNTKVKLGLEEINDWEKIKRVAFRAWKAGIDKTKRDYDLIQHKSMEPSKFFF